jgi:hypothetical protein
VARIETEPVADELRIRIRVVSPPPNVRFQVQRGKDGLVPPARRSSSSTDFEFAVRVGTQKDGSPNFLGPFAQGPPDARFVYVNSGTLAGDAQSCWTRRAKVPLGGLGWTLIRKARSTGGFVEAEIDGVARDGGPACASVPLRRSWHVVAAGERTEQTKSQKRRP